MRRPPASPTVPAAVVVAALAVAAVCALPLAVIAVSAASLGGGSAWELLWRPRVGELMGNTLSLVGLTAAAAAVVGVGAAWLVERTSLPGASVWRVLLVAPLAVPAFVNSYAWISLAPRLEGLAGAVLVTTLSYFPFVFLPVSALLRGLDPGLEDSARSLGLGPWRTFARAVLPQLRPAALGGVLLVALHLLAEFGVLAMMRFPTFTTAILEQFEVAFNASTGSLLAVVLVGLTITFLTIEVLARGRRRHARVGGGTARRTTSARLGGWAPVALLALGGLAALSLGVPLWSIGYWLLLAGASPDLGELAAAVLATLRLAVLAGLITSAAAFPAAWLAGRTHGWLSGMVERVTYVASSLPGVVVALALVTLAIDFARPLYQTSTLLLVAYTVLFIPRAMVSIRASMSHAPPELSEAARALGESPGGAFRRVLLPLTLPGAMAGFAMVFIATTTELTATLLLAPTGTRTLATAFWSASDSIDYAGAAPYAAAMVVLSAPLTYLVLRRPHEEPVL